VRRSALRLVLRRLLLPDLRRLEPYFLQAITGDDDDYEVEFAILLHQSAGERVSRRGFLRDLHRVRQLLPDPLQGDDFGEIFSIELLE